MKRLQPPFPTLSPLHFHLNQPQLVRPATSGPSRATSFQVELNLISSLWPNMASCVARYMVWGSSHTAAIFHNLDKNLERVKGVWLKALEWTSSINYPHSSINLQEIAELALCLQQTGEILGFFFLLLKLTLWQIFHMLGERKKKKLQQHCQH